MNRTPDLSLARRGFVSQAGAWLAASALAPPSLHGQQQTSYSGEFPDMLVAYLASRLNPLAERWNRERERISTAEQLEARNRFVRKRLAEMIHGLPQPVPLQAVTVNKFERRGYRVENVMFQSRPNFWVTGNLYIPTRGSGPYAAIISPCGHYPLARMEPEYQFAYMDLALSGFVVLAYDPIGQGERRQYWNPKTGQEDVPTASTYEHSMPGQILLLMGEDLTHYFVGDGMRAIDYLLARPEVDPKRIGCAGHSGGATQTRFISALDSRVSCAAVNQDGTGHRWPISSRPGGRLGLSDIEQNAFPAALDGIDNCDMLTAIAPRPLLLTIENYSPAFHTTAGHLKQRYRQLGAEEKFATEEANDPHSWTAKLRLATADWFSRCYYGRPGPDREPDLEPERAETLRCTPAGSLREARKGDSIFTIIAAKGGRITPERPVPSGKTELDSFRAQMLGQIRKLIRYDATAHPLGARHISTTPRRGYQVEHVEFLSEPGIYIPAWVFKPERRDGGPPTVFVHEAGKQVEGLEFGRLEKLARKGRLIVAVDVRGIGETEPRYQASDRTGDFGHLFNVETGLAYSAWYLDQSLFGMRVRDVVRSVEYALSRPDANASGARLVGKGAGALWCLFAAALESRVAELVAENGLISYRSLTTVDRYRHGAAVFVPDILKHFDLPQVAAIIASRNVTLVSPVDPMKRHLDLPSAGEAYSWTRQVFEKAGAVDRFRIVAQMEL